jgi:hypothetical protein
MKLHFLFVALFTAFAAFAASPGSDYKELLTGSEVYVIKNIPEEPSSILQKILASGYAPSEKEANQLRFFRIAFEKNGRFVELEALIVCQVIQDELNSAPSKYTLARGLNRLREAVAVRDVTPEEVESMRKAAQAKTKHK